jgi:bla regulator protein blaR1
MTGAFMAAIAIKATVILAIGLGALRGLRHSRAAVRHLVLLAACASVLALPVAAWLLPGLAIPVPYDEPVSLMPGVAETWADAGFTSVAGDGGLPTTTGSSESVSITRLVLIAEGLGATLALLPVIAGLWQTRRLRAAARQWSRGQKRIERLVEGARIRRHVDVLLHDGLPGPVTCGLWRPVLLFPADATHWDDKDFERAAIHELEHVRRNDWATACFARIVCALYWFHPLVWMTCRRLRLESERAADDAVVRKAEATAYADLLVTFAQRFATGEPHYVLAMANRRDLPMRITALLDTSRPRGRAGRRCVAAIALLAAGVVLGVAPLGTIAEVRAAAEQGQPSPQIVGLGNFSQFEPVQRPAVDPNTRFEVVAIKPIAGEMARMVRMTPGRFEATVPVGLLLRQALQKADYQIAGAPGWIDTERYSISAKVPEGVPNNAVGVLLTNLLKDRFQLATHLEIRELPIFNLVVARADGRLGPDLKVTSAECSATSKERMAAATAAAGRGERPAAPSPGSPDGLPPCGFVRTGAGIAAGSGRTIADLVPTLADVVGRPVVDKTGLTGMYDYLLKFAPDSARAPGLVRLLSPETPLPAGDANAPSLAAALQEQLGLKLESARGAIEVVVIDKIEKPTPD